MNTLDRLIGYLSPERAVKRAQAKRLLAYYEAATSNRLKKSRTDRGDGNAVTLRAGDNLRVQARHLDQNHDLARGILNTLVANIVGPEGISVEPQPLKSNNEIHTDFARQLSALWKRWGFYPEVTHELDWPAAQRLACRSWLRDGEIFASLFPGESKTLEHGSLVPFSIELLEADLVPFDSADNNAVMGVVRNAYGRPKAYIVRKRHPGGLEADLGTTIISADRIIHLKLTDRVRQIRGVSIFAPVINRLEGIKDYEESEMVAAKVAASMAAYIKKGTPDMYDPQTDDDPRNMKFRPGMIFDNLLPGEEVGTIDTKRPNSALADFRSSQIRAVAAGTMVSYSSAAKDYNGTYSAQRQELVEQYGHYGVLQAQFISQFVRPIWSKFVDTVISAGLVKPPRGIVSDINNAEFRGPVMPWIDPLKEVEAQALSINTGLASRYQVIRDRGETPDDVLAQIKQEKEIYQSLGIGEINVPGTSVG